jgi:hypothetical protein
VSVLDFSLNHWSSDKDFRDFAIIWKVDLQDLTIRINPPGLQWYRRDTGPLQNKQIGTTNSRTTWTKWLEMTVSLPFYHCTWSVIDTTLTVKRFFFDTVTILFTITSRYHSSSPICKIWNLQALSVHVCRRWDTRVPSFLGDRLHLMLMMSTSKMNHSFCELVLGVRGKMFYFQDVLRLLTYVKTSSKMFWNIQKILYGYVTTSSRCFNNLEHLTN